MKLHLYFCISVLAGLSVQAQTVFSASSLPSQFGAYNCSYFCTNVDVTQLLALATTNSVPTVPGAGTNVAQYWDLSGPQQPYESILRTDIIDPQYGGDSQQFPNAAYAEQDTLDATNIIGWRYYGFTNGNASSGRICYGLDAPEDEPISEWAAFVPPTVDIPSTVKIGQAWSGSLCWLSSYFEVVTLSNYYAFTATVDAFGTLVLPEIGPVSALRVHEIDGYTVSASSLPQDSNTNQYYYWLVPGIGVAAEVLLLGNNVLSPSDMPCTNIVQRMYSASYFTNSVNNDVAYSPSTNDLQITAQNDSVILNWSTLSNVANCRIEYTESLTSTWQTLGYTTNTSWTDTVASAQRFYRIVGVP